MKAIDHAERASKILERKADDMRGDYPVLVRLLTRIESLTKDAAFTDKWETRDPFFDELPTQSSQHDKNYLIFLEK